MSNWLDTRVSPEDVERPAFRSWRDCEVRVFRSRASKALADNVRTSPSGRAEADLNAVLM